MISKSKNELVRKLSICGQVAEHKSIKIQEHQGDESNILLALSTTEQEQLEGLLSKLETAWIEDHKKHHNK